MVVVALSLRYGARAERGLAARTPEQIASGEHRVRTLAPQTRHGWPCAGRRRPRRRGRPRAGGRPIASGVCSERTVSIRPVRTPSGISSTRSSHIARNWPTPQGLARAAAGGSGAGTAPRRGRRCRRRPARPGPSAGRRSAAGCAGSAPRRPSGRRRRRSGSGPSAAITASCRSRPISSHWVAPRRSAYAVVVLQTRSRTWPTGGAGGRRDGRRTCRSARGGRG